MNTGTIVSPADGLQLSLIYSEPSDAPKGIVQIAHGMCEHKERYIPGSATRFTTKRHTRKSGTIFFPIWPADPRRR